MPLELQGKLLRVLQQKELTRVGGTRAIPLDVRVITATNCDLQALTKAGKFRADLFFRLNVFPISIPPLRSRPDDILLLAEHFFNDYNIKYSKKVRISGDALALFASYPWPGNVRELQNVVERLILISDQSSVIDGDSLLPMLRLEQPLPGPDAAPTAPEKTLKEIVDEFERRIVEHALRQHGSTRKAAAALGIDQSTIVKKAKRLQIHPR